MEDQKQLNIYKKLQKVRYELSLTELKKSGKAKAKDGTVKYDYFELKDFLPDIIKLCYENGITEKFTFETLENAKLEIIDNDKPEDIIVFPMPTKVSQLLMCNEMQNIGGAKTYAKRYLYFDAFEIAENDETEVKSTEPGALQKINSVQLKVIKQLIQETGTDEMQFMSWATVSDIKDMTVNKLPSAMRLLNQKKEELNKEKMNQNK